MRDEPERVIAPPFVDWHMVPVRDEIDAGRLRGALDAAFGDRLANWQIDDGEMVYVAVWSPEAADDGDLVRAAIDEARTE